MGIDVSRLGPLAQKQILRKLQAGQTKQPKYRNKKTQRLMPNGSVFTFDSQKEARRYDELALLLAAGRIRNLRLQQNFTLQEAYTDSRGERVRGIIYKADFVYETRRRPGSQVTGIMEDGWVRVVEDVKSRGTRTKDYSIKRKLMQERFGIAIEEV